MHISKIVLHMSSTIFNSDTPFYTPDHEWIRFEGRQAYIGVCPFKLTGIPRIDRVEFCNLSVKQPPGSLIATLISDDYSIKIHMPVEGWLVECNPRLISEPGLLKDVSGKNWIARIMPSSPYSRNDLLNAIQYKQMMAFQKSKA